MGSRGARASGRGREEGWGAGWVIWKPRAATVGLRRSEPLASRAPSSERTGPQRAPPGSSPEPVSPARGLRSCGPAYARGPAAAAGAGDVALRGAAAGPTCHPLPFPRLFGAPTSERGQVQWLPLFSLPFPSVVSPSVVVPAPASSSALAAATAAAPPAPSFADVELSLPFLLKVPFSLAERRKSSRDEDRT